MSQERDRIFFRNFSIVLIVLVLFTIAAAWLGNRLGAVQYQGQEQVAAAARTAPVGAVNTEPVAQPPAPAPATPPPASAPASAATDPGEATYKQVCFACHATPALGAPVLGKREDWEPRVAKGVDTLVRHAIEGFQGEKGLMPPKGGRPDLSDEDVAAAVHYMLRQAGLEPEGEKEETAATGAAAVAQPVSAADGKAAYEGTCFVCHTPGAAGAPKLGDHEAWASRAGKGRDTLYRHAIDGFAGDTGVMPPKGGRVDLSDAQVRAAVDYMLTQAGL